MDFFRCAKCLLPNTKPDLRFHQGGQCSACLNYEVRRNIDWKAREEQFIGHFEKNKRNTGDWDCVVPVSGGKDSSYQVLKLLSLGLRPLAVTSSTCDLTQIGRDNLNNLRMFGVDLIEVSPNPLVRARLNRIGLEEVGDISWPEHVGIFTIPVRVAMNFGVDTIIWGENSQNEYGGPEDSVDAFELDRRWLEEFGGLLGLRIKDLQESFGLSSSDLSLYQYPEAKELEESGIRGLFLGQFFEWNGLSNALLAKANGFQTPSSRIRGSLVDYENLDNHQAGIHDYFKYLKFGFGRATDIASNLIRRNVINREEALRIVQEVDGEYPSEYLGKELVDILKPLDISVSEFDQICDRFTNTQLFEKSENSEIERRKDGSPKLRQMSSSN